jgi:ferric-dicitrate binding protein FerR (iron transport regulator)
MQAVVSNEMGTFTVTTADATAVADWRKPGLTFKNEALGAVVLQLSDRFGRQVRLDATAPADCRYTARFPQADLNAVLANLTAVFGVQVDTSDPGVIRLRGGQCTNE